MSGELAAFIVVLCIVVTCFVIAVAMTEIILDKWWPRR